MKLPTPDRLLILRPEIYRMIKLVLIVFALQSVVLAQAEKKPDVWESMRFFVGSWVGTGAGQPGASEVERDYQFVLNEKYLQVKTRSVYKPQQKNPKGEIHEDWGFFSYDRARKKFVLRQFHVEGFVNQYALENSSSDGKSLAFVSESIENIPQGWLARETYRIVSDNEFIEVFELAGPGKEFEVYSESRLKRKK